MLRCGALFSKVRTGRLVSVGREITLLRLVLLLLNSLLGCLSTVVRVFVFTLTGCSSGLEVNTRRGFDARIFPLVFPLVNTRRGALVPTLSPAFTVLVERTPALELTDPLGPYDAAGRGFAMIYFPPNPPP